MCYADLLDNVEAIAARHLDVEEQKVVATLLECRDDFPAIAAFARDRKFPDARQQESEAFPRQRLIVRDESF